MQLTFKANCYVQFKPYINCINRNCITEINKLHIQQIVKCSYLLIYLFSFNLAKLRSRKRNNPEIQLIGTRIYLQGTGSFIDYLSFR